VSGANAVSEGLSKLLSRQIDTDTVLALQRPSHAESCSDLSNALELLEHWKKWFLSDLEQRKNVKDKEICRQIVEQG
jgi:hypothetical protein